MSIGGQRSPVHRATLLAFLLAAPALCLAGDEPAAAPRSFVGRAGPARWIELDAAPATLLTWDAYRELARRLGASDVFVPLREPLEGSLEGVRYGLNAVLPIGEVENVHNVSWALAGNEASGFVLIVDLDGSGSLRNDRPLEFRRRGGLLVAERELRLAGAGGAVARFPVRWILRSEAAQPALYRVDWRERRGVVRVDGRDVLFALRSTRPRFDGPGALVGLDTDGDGAIAFGASAVEVYEVAERYATLGNREYELLVAPGGERLTLRPTGRPGMPRAPLALGTRAPVLESGLPLSLASGRPLLLEFWSPRCSVCRRMAPRVDEAERGFRAAVFASVTDVGGAGARGHDRPNIDGETGERLFRLNRVREIPTYYVIDETGIIRAKGHTLEWEEITETLAGLLEDRAPAADAGHD